ncbi:FecCD family ABC transporter permease [Chloroflexota bacterium]
MSGLTKIKEAPAVEEVYTQLTRRKMLFILGVCALLVAFSIAATAIGAASLTVGESFQAILARIFPALQTSGFADTIIWQLRLPRILMAIITGLSLGVAGAVMQGVLRNPLVSPYTLGLSAGAACGAGIAIALGVGIFGTGRYLIVGNAFIFSLLTMFLVLLISRIRGTAIETLILAGVALGYLFSATISILKYVSDTEALREIVFWLMGGLYMARWETVFLLLPVVTVIIIIAMRYSWDLNVMGSGEEVAMSLGVRVNRIRIVCLAISALMTASVIAFTGIIGFIGLVSPHICRSIVGSDHRFLIPASGLMGGLILLVSDTICRTLIQPTEIPVGILTAFIGVPFFLYLLMRKRRSWWQ